MPGEGSPDKTTFLLISEHCTRSNDFMPSEGTSDPAFSVGIQGANSISASLNDSLGRASIPSRGSASPTLRIAPSILLTEHAVFR